MTQKVTGFFESKTSRIEAFSDGVFAIVITLLVFQIKIPELHDTLSSQEAWKALVGLAPNFLDS
ncbi:MAG TPA: TMEM175 family protein [Thermodesulfobacteriota bacterium]|nr:TMEM175 family protein [Thermodesulfobacteriota bacterium]